MEISLCRHIESRSNKTKRRRRALGAFVGRDLKGEKRKGGYKNTVESTESMMEIRNLKISRTLKKGESRGVPKGDGN